MPGSVKFDHSDNQVLAIANGRAPAVLQDGVGFNQIFFGQIDLTGRNASAAEHAQKAPQVERISADEDASCRCFGPKEQCDGCRGITLDLQETSQIHE